MRMKSFTALDSSPQSVFLASLNQLQRILFDYQACDQSKSCSIWLAPASLQVSNAVLNIPDHSDWHFYFSLCMRYWKECAICFPAAIELAQATLTLALSRGRMTGQEASTFIESILEQTKHHDMTEISTVSAIIDFELAMSSKVDIRSNALAKRFNELVMFNELTTDGQDNLAE
jgi:hypothetical protein